MTERPTRCVSEPETRHSPATLGLGSAPTSRRPRLVFCSHYGAVLVGGAADAVVLPLDPDVETGAGVACFGEN